MVDGGVGELEACGEGRGGGETTIEVLFLNSPSEGDFEIPFSAAAPSSLFRPETLLANKLLLLLLDFMLGAGLGALFPSPPPPPSRPPSGSADVDLDNIFEMLALKLPLRFAFASACVRAVTGGWDLSEPETLRRNVEREGVVGRREVVLEEVGREGRRSILKGGRSVGGKGTTPTHSGSLRSTTPPMLCLFAAACPCCPCCPTGAVVLRCRTVPRLAASPASSPLSCANGIEASWRSWDLAGRGGRWRVCVEVERESAEAKETEEGDAVRVAGSSGRRLTSFFFFPCNVSPPPPPPTGLGSGEFARSEKAPAVLAKETWELFQRDLSTPRIDSGETGREEEVMKDVDGVTVPCPTLLTPCR